MKFDELDARMRIFETNADQFVLPGIYIVARLDGRGFTRMTKEVHAFEAPFDERFRDLMLDTTEALVTEFNAVYGYTQSDEISLLFPLGSDLFNRKHRKLNSILAGFASARFTHGLGAVACMDCRICELPSARHVVDYFRWRNEDAHRNSLNAHCYWLLRKSGATGNAAYEALQGKTVSEKNELLFQNGINFNDLPSWQKRGSGIFWSDVEREGVNPLTGERCVAIRRRLTRELALPSGEAYGDFVRGFLE